MNVQGLKHIYIGQVEQSYSNKINLTYLKLRKKRKKKILKKIKRMMIVNQKADQTVNHFHHLLRVNHTLRGVPLIIGAVGATPHQVVVLVSAGADTQKIH